MRTYVFVYPVPNNIKKIISFKSDDFIIAVDQAFNDLYKQNIKVDLLVGDLDSIDNTLDISNINKHILKPEKDETDSFYALNKAYEASNDVVMIGGIGGSRIEHFYAHTRLFKHFPLLKIQNENTLIYRLDKGIHKNFEGGYISIFGYPKATLSLSNFKYPLNKYQMDDFDILGISNEPFENATIEIHEGSIIIFESL